MKLTINIEENNHISMRLKNGAELYETAWRDGNNLSRSMLVRLDRLLARGGAGVDKISGYTIISKVPKNWTTCRIAEITLRSLMIAGLAR